jgi:hypothetical protein
MPCRTRQRRGQRRQRTGQQRLPVRPGAHAQPGTRGPVGPIGPIGPIGSVRSASSAGRERDASHAGLTGAAGRESCAGRRRPGRFGPGGTARRGLSRPARPVARPYARPGRRRGVPPVVVPPRRTIPGRTGRRSRHTGRSSPGGCGPGRHTGRGNKPSGHAARRRGHGLRARQRLGGRARGRMQYRPVPGRSRRHVPGRATRRGDRRPCAGRAAAPCRGPRPGWRRRAARTRRRGSTSGRPGLPQAGPARRRTRRTRRARRTGTRGNAGTCGPPAGPARPGRPHRDRRNRRDRLVGHCRLRPQAGLMPDPGENHDLVFLGQRCQPAPGLRFSEIPHLRHDQLRQPLALQNRPGCQPGQNPWWQDIQPEVGVTERQTENGEDDDVRQSDCREHGYLADRQRHRQPEVVQLVEPLLDPPDIRVGGQIHQLHPFRSRGYQWTPSALAMPVASVCTMDGV